MKPRCLPGSIQDVIMATEYSNEDGNQMDRVKRVKCCQMDVKENIEKIKSKVECRQQKKSVRVAK